MDIAERFMADPRNVSPSEVTEAKASSPRCATTTTRSPRSAGCASTGASRSCPRATSRPHRVRCSRRLSSARTCQSPPVSRLLVAAPLCMLFVALPVEAAPNAGTRTVTIRLISTEYSGKTIVDQAPRNVVSRGDVIVVTSFLRNAVAQFGRPKGAEVGADNATFTIVTSTQADMRLEMNLPGGTLTAGGRIRFGPIQTYSVRGGSGKYLHARGTGESRSLPADKFGGGDRRTKTYRLRLP